MSIEFGDAVFYIDNESISKAAITNLETSYDHLDKEKLMYDISAKFSDVIFNTELIDQLCFPNNKTFKIQSEIPIMIQARWHKKRRINKKWLKRYGMKPDTVKIEMDVNQLEYTPGEYIDRCETGIIGTYNSFNFSFKTNEIRYIFRPDQLRHGIKIEV